MMGRLKLVMWVILLLCLFTTMMSSIYHYRRDREISKKVNGVDQWTKEAVCGSREEGHAWYVSGIHLRKEKDRRTLFIVYVPEWNDFITDVVYRRPVIMELTCRNCGKKRETDLWQCTDVDWDIFMDQSGHLTEEEQQKRLDSFKKERLRQLKPIMEQKDDEGEGQ